MNIEERNTQEWKDGARELGFSELFIESLGMSGDGNDIKLMNEQIN